MGIPGSSRKKTKAKRSKRSRKRHISLLRLPEYKVKLTAASGGSLTIRYRRRPSLSPSYNCANVRTGSTSFTAACAEVNTSAVEPWIVGTHIGYSQSLCKSYSQNNLEDEKQTFIEGSEDLVEYNQSSSCVSGSIPSDAVCYVNSNDCVESALPCFPSSYVHSWSPSALHDDHCRSSDVGSTETLPEYIKADKVAMSSTAFSSWHEDSENSNSSFATFEDQMQQYHSEQNADLAQHLKFFNADDIEVNSTLHFMEAHEQFGARFWSFTQSENSLTDLSNTNAEELNSESSSGSMHMNTLRFHPLLADEMASSGIEVFELSPLLCYKTADQACFQDTALQLYELPYENDAANDTHVDVNSSAEEAEPFDESTFLLLDMPDEVNLATSDILQSADKCTLLFESALQGIEKVAVQDPIEDGVTGREELISTGKSARKQCSGLLEPAAGSVGQANPMLCTMDPGAALIRGKNKRRKRLRRATPLNTLKSLLSCSTDEVPTATYNKEDCQLISVDSSSPDDFSCFSIASRRAPRRRNSLLPERSVSTLRKWFHDHVAFPFADKKEKLDLASRTGLSLTQVGNWLSNRRHKLRIKKSDYFVRDAFSPDDDDQEGFLQI